MKSTMQAMNLVETDAVSGGLMPAFLKSLVDWVNSGGGTGGGTGGGDVYMPVGNGFCTHGVHDEATMSSRYIGVDKCPPVLGSYPNLP